MTVCKGQELYEFLASMSIPDQSEDVSVIQVKACHKGKGAMPLVLVIPAPYSMFSSDRHQIGSNVCNGLDTRLFIIREGRVFGLLVALFSCLLGFFINQKYLAIFCSNYF